MATRRFPADEPTTTHVLEYVVATCVVAGAALLAAAYYRAVIGAIFAPVLGELAAVLGGTR